MNDPDAAAKELDRAAGMGARGVQMYSNAAGKPLDAPEFQPLFDELARRDLGVWLPPANKYAITRYNSDGDLVETTSFESSRWVGTTGRLDPEGLTLFEIQAQ